MYKKEEIKTKLEIFFDWVILTPPWVLVWLLYPLGGKCYKPIYFITKKLIDMYIYSCKNI